MGMRVRLKASFDIGGFTPNLRVILAAMKTYGMFVADNGSNWFISGAPDPRWSDDELVSGFRGVHGGDFEVVGPPASPYHSIIRWRDAAAPTEPAFMSQIGSVGFSLRPSPARSFRPAT